MTVWALWFSWPAGQVWPNLVAALIGSVGTGGLLAWRALVRIDMRHEAQRGALAAEHTEHRELLARQLAAHHQAVLAAVTPQEGDRS